MTIYSKDFFKFVLLKYALNKNQVEFKLDILFNFRFILPDCCHIYTGCPRKNKEQVPMNRVPLKNAFETQVLVEIGLKRVPYSLCKIPCCLPDSTHLPFFSETTCRTIIAIDKIMVLFGNEEIGNIEKHTRLLNSLAVISFHTFNSAIIK